MNERRRTLAMRLADAADLMIDFATLGEYGLEPVAQAQAPACRAGRRRATRHPAHLRGSARLAPARR